MGNWKYIYQADRSEFLANITVNTLETREYLASKTRPLIQLTHVFNESIGEHRNRIISPPVSVCLCVCVCLPVCLSLYLSIYLYTYLSISVIQSTPNILYSIHSVVETSSADINCQMSIFVDLKHITLITDRPSSVIRLLWTSSDISILSYLTIKPKLEEACHLAKNESKHKRRCPPVIEQLFSRRVYVCLAKTSLQDTEYVLFLKDLLGLKKASSPLGVQPITALLTDGLETLPAELRGYLPISMVAGAVNPHEFHQFLENVERDRLEKIESVLKIPNGKWLANVLF